MTSEHSVSKKRTVGSYLRKETGSLLEKHGESELLQY